MAKVPSTEPSSDIPISQLPLYSSPAQEKYQDVDDAGIVNKTIRSFMLPITRVSVPAYYKVKAGGERVKEIGTTGYAHTLSTVNMIQEEPYGPGAILAGASLGFVLGLRGGKIRKLVFSLAGGGAGAALYYNQQTVDLSIKAYNYASEKVMGLVSTKDKKSEEPPTESKKES